MDMTLGSLLFVPFGLGLLGFVEPCTVGAHVIFLSEQKNRPPRARAASLIAFIAARVTVLGAVGALAGLIGQALVDIQTGFWLVFGVLYVLIGLLFLVGSRDWAKWRISRLPDAWRYARNPFVMGAVFGLNIPACAAPILFGLLGMTLATGAVAGFAMMAVFGLTLSLPLVPMALMPSFAGWMARGSMALRSRPWIAGTAFLVLGAWSIFFGLFVDPADWNWQ